MAKLFFSYSHKDEDLRDELETHLSMLKRQKIIETWHDRKIGLGEEFDNEICAYLSEANIILLLISPYFLDSDYCYNIELSKALEMHSSNEAVVIPVILHPCDWNSSSFGKLTASPKDGKPISSFDNIHEAFLDVTKSIRKVAEKYKNRYAFSDSIDLERLDEKKEKILSEYGLLMNKFDRLKSSYQTEHRELIDWLSKNKKILVDRIYLYVLDYYKHVDISYPLPIASKEIRMFKRDLSQDIRHFEVCLLEENSQILDEPSFMVQFDPELYRIAYDYLYSRVPETVLKKSKLELKKYIDYLLTRI